MKPKITVDNFVCSTKELLDEKEKRYGTPNNRARWDMSEYSQGVIDRDDSFPTISIALKVVCDILCFSYDRKDWHFGLKDREFHAEFYVDEDNRQITEEEYNMWKRGEKRIWVCEVSVRILVTEQRELSQFELTKFGY